MDDTSDQKRPTSDSPNIAVLEALQQLLEIKFPLHSFTYELQSATEKGENYIGVVYRVVVHLKTIANTFSLSLILKIPPQSLIRRKQFFIRPCFLRESLAYEEFLPMVKEFQASKGISGESGFHEYAECFRTLTDEYNEAIFLEDLRLQDFHLFDRFNEFRYEHVEIVMRTYAKLHAVSLAIKDQEPRNLDKFRHIKDIFEQRKDDPNLNAYFEQLKISTQACLNSINDERYQEVLNGFFKRPFFDIFLDHIDGKKYERYAVMCHGDCWSNNIMFKYKDAKVVAIRLLDWQLLRYSSPLTDLMYFLFTCTSREFRRAHYTKVLDIYYDELNKQIRRLGSKPSETFPRKAFESELQNRGAVGLLFAMIVLPIITIKGEDVPNLEELSERVEAGRLKDLKGSGLLCEGNVNAYDKRMRDVIIDCIDYGYIK